MKIALATPHFPTSITEGLNKVQQLAADAAQQGAVVVCFPETFIPGYPLADVQVPKASQQELAAALDKVCEITKANNIAIIIPMDWYEGDKFYNLAQVVSAEGKVLGYQTKNQLDPSEDTTWQPGTERQLFEVGTKIRCHYLPRGFPISRISALGSTRGCACGLPPLSQRQ